LAQCGIAGFSFLIRPFSSMLLAAQRFEINYLTNAAAFLLSLPLAWWGFCQGWGLWSVMAGCLLQHLLGAVASTIGVWRMGLLKPLKASGFGSSVSLKTILQESLSFSVGPIATICAGFLQSVFLSRLLGLEAVAAWNVGAKAATVLGQILSKFFESSFGGLSELLETGRRDRMFERFGQVLGWSMVLCTSLVLILILFNGFFIGIWTGQTIPWPVEATWAVGLMLFLVTLHRALFEVTKILLLWREIRLSPLLDFGILALCLSLAYGKGGFLAFTYAAALGPFLGGLVINSRALRRAWGQPLWNLIPIASRAWLLAFMTGCLGAVIWTSRA